MRREAAGKRKQPTIEGERKSEAPDLGRAVWQNEAHRKKEKITCGSRVPDMGLEHAGPKKRDEQNFPEMGLEPMIFFACGGPKLFSLKRPH